MVLLGLLENSNDSEWGATYPPYLKPKTKIVHFLSDFINLNKKFKHEPYPMPNMNEHLLKLEGF